MATNINNQGNNDEKKLNKTNLKSLKKAELVQLALKMNLSDATQLKKEEIIDRILEIQEAQESKSKDEEKKPIRKVLDKTDEQTYSASKKYEVEDAELFIEPTYPIETKELPIEYGDTKLTLLIRDPWWSYAYWEINDETRRKFGIIRGHNKNLKLRLYDITEGNYDTFYDTDIHDYTSNWYINLPKPGRVYILDLIAEKDGNEDIVIRSNEETAPSADISEDIDVEWMTPDWTKIMGASIGIRGENITEQELGEGKILKITNLSSLSIAELIGQQLLGGSEQLLKSISSLPSSESAIKIVEAGKDFWLRADCELIVYGATEPDATVKVKGEIINLKPDGSFTLRFAFPDGEHKIDIVATNKDGDMEKSIIFDVSRASEYNV